MKQDYETVMDGTNENKFVEGLSDLRRYGRLTYDSLLKLCKKTDMTLKPNGIQSYEVLNRHNKRIATLDL